jgi:hypothetical protein
MAMVSLIVALIFLSIYGCENKRPPAPGSGEIVARINNYVMTADDFKDEAKLVLSNKKLDADPYTAKKQLLGELITKEVLLQEAQRQNFDKDKAFMKEIERYWEQALLKLLINKKTKELSKSVVTGSKAARQEKIQKELNEWILGLKSRAVVKEYDENLKEVVLE